ncbi:prefoldin subunit [Ophiostoma piceae UAMH 11346]|uniref:Prefoldin subunit n=1 Tax=Ophiostoma piceae (strain UAMH 11346) TaxID=1262450 RepID=S3BPT6_OPHP1|nr:prefoldin subunit [Ophiostoma piceae UAMH 11346]
MVLRTALSKGVALCGPELRSALHPTTQFRRTATSMSVLRPALARRALTPRSIRAPKKTTKEAKSFSTEATVPVIRGNIDPKTGRPRTRTTTSSSSSSSSRTRTWPRYPKFLKDSPSKTLSLRVQSRSQPLEFETWKLFDNAASSKSMRLPIVTLQHMIRQDEAQQGTSLSDGLCSDEELRRRSSVLAYKGVTQEDLRTWAWILAIDNPDARAARFLSPDLAGSSRPKPVFMLLQILQRNNAFIKGKTLVKLHQYIDEHHVKARMANPQLPFGAVRRSLDSGLNMTPQTFVLTMRMLVHHYLRIWPSALTAVATLMSDYIKTIPHMAHVAAKKRAAEDGTEAEGSSTDTEQTIQDRKVYADMCYVFNSGLELFRQKAPVEPVLNMRYNWRAQRVLLATSTSQDIPRPLLISRDGFRSIRHVLLALGKSPEERRVSMRMARTWPPYRRDWDGLDEQRRPKDDFSRSVQAGAMMHEAGYGDMDHERALNVLGGVVPGESPTVQTRTLGPRIWKGPKANLNLFSEWAARVRATRDVNEAWREFDGRPSKIKPSLQVYTEMFLKLFAAPVERHHPAESASSTATWPHGKELLPGDAREVYPVHDATLTPFERARISPPTVGQLYNRMMVEGTRPAGECLAVLIKNATNLGDVMRYLYDSGMDERTIGALRLPDSFTASPLSRPSPVIPSREHKKYEDIWKSEKSQPVPSQLERVQSVPLPVLSAYITVLCRLQPTVSHTPAGPMKQLRTQMVHHAIRLAMMRLPPGYESGRSYLAPYHTIVKRLSYPKVLVGPEHTTDAALHNQEALAMCLELFAHLRKIGSGTDDMIFRSIIRAALVYSNDVDCSILGTGWVGDAVDDNSGRSFDYGSTPELMRTAHATIVEMFNDIVTDGPNQYNVSHPATRHNIKAFTLDIYIKFLGYLRDTENMTAALLWVASVYDDPVLLEDAKDVDHLQHSALQRSLILYRVVAEASSSPRDAARMAEVEAQFTDLRERGSSWQWPNREDADRFVLWKQAESRQKEFWRRIRPVGQDNWR